MLLLSKRNIPFYKIVADTCRSRFDPVDPTTDHRQGVGDIKKGIRLVFGQDFLQAKISGLSLGKVESMPSFLEQPVYLRIIIMNKI
jgi:hypothetical protein